MGGRPGRHRPKLLAMVPLGLFMNWLALCFRRGWRAGWGWAVLAVLPGPVLCGLVLADVFPTTHGTQGSSTVWWHPYAVGFAALATATWVYQVGRLVMRAARARAVELGGWRLLVLFGFQAALWSWLPSLYLADSFEARLLQEQLSGYSTAVLPVAGILILTIGLVVSAARALWRRFAPEPRARSRWWQVWRKRPGSPARKVSEVPPRVTDEWSARRRARNRPRAFKAPMDRLPKSHAKTK